ncbi:MAG: hypothetical protein JO316_11955 [Abitibacteriaceae bacterium]|nr:hypothetical protein [Abditibacteriaceae bacterium]
MSELLMRLFGHRMFHKAVAQHTNHGGVLDVQLGFAMLRDRRVPLTSKLMALALGAVGVAVLINLELPLQALLALMLPILGFAGDFVIDGVEGVVGPFVLASLLLPHLAPEPITQAIRSERAGLPAPVSVRN